MRASDGGQNDNKVHESNNNLLTSFSGPGLPNGTPRGQGSGLDDPCSPYILGWKKKNPTKAWLIEIILTKSSSPRVCKFVKRATTSSFHSKTILNLSFNDLKRVESGTTKDVCILLASSPDETPEDGGVVDCDDPYAAASWTLGSLDDDHDDQDMATATSDEQISFSREMAPRFVS